MIEALRPTDLAQLNPGQVIRPVPAAWDGTDDPPAQLPDLTVSEKRQNAAGWVILGQPVVKDRRRRVTVEYAPGETANVVATDRDLDEIRNALGWAIEGREGAPTDLMVKVVCGTSPALTVEVNGWVVTL